MSLANRYRQILQSESNMGYGLGGIAMGGKRRCVKWKEVKKPKHKKGTNADGTKRKVNKWSRFLAAEYKATGIPITVLAGMDSVRKEYYLTH